MVAATASAYCHEAALRAGDDNGFHWSTPRGTWVASLLTIVRAGVASAAAEEGTASTAGEGATQRHAETVRFAGCLVAKFNGDYKLQAAAANGRPHWFSDDKTEGGLHLYWGPQKLWLLRSVFRPNEKACSAYCDASDGISTQSPLQCDLWEI